MEELSRLLLFCANLMFISQSDVKGLNLREQFFVPPEPVTLTCPEKMNSTVSWIQGKTLIWTGRIFNPMSSLASRSKIVDINQDLVIINTSKHDEAVYVCLHNMKPTKEYKISLKLTERIATTIFVELDSAESEIKSYPSTENVINVIEEDTSFNNTVAYSTIGLIACILLIICTCLVIKVTNARNKILSELNQAAVQESGRHDADQGLGNNTDNIYHEIDESCMFDLQIAVSNRRQIVKPNDDRSSSESNVYTSSILNDDLDYLHPYASLLDSMKEVYEYEKLSQGKNSNFSKSNETDISHTDGVVKEANIEVHVGNPDESQGIYTGSCNLIDTHDESKKPKINDVIPFVKKCTWLPIAIPAQL